jgi:hypothetical protein
MTAEIVKFETVAQRNVRLKAALDQAFYEALADKYACPNYHKNEQNDATLSEELLKKNKKVRSALQEYNLFLEKYFSAKPVEIHQIIIEVKE